MKITKVEPILISVPYDRGGGPVPKADAVPWRNMDTLLVRVETSDGITGWGEAFGFGAPHRDAHAAHQIGRTVGDRARHRRYPGADG